jgi:hypothetical protein
MKHLVIGAGATFAEALELGVPAEQCPPLIRDFARKTWWNYSPYPLLPAFLRGLGYEDIGNDSRELFYRLEHDGVASIESFLEFAWMNRHDVNFLNQSDLPPGYISGLRLVDSAAGDVEPLGDAGDEFWSNLLWHGIGSPLQLMMYMCFFENGVGWKDFKLSKQVADKFLATDLVLNLNYDTVFELALDQMGKSFCYCPVKDSDEKLLVCKPHGSLNLVTNEDGFEFGSPEWLGMPQPPGYLSYSGIIPPRLNKDYSQHPVAATILGWIKDRKPEKVVMWGVGLTESDKDLMGLYAGWLTNSKVLEIINPSVDVANKAASIFNISVRHYLSVDEWAAEQPQV